MRKKRREWHMVRLQRSTVEKLRQLAERWQETYGTIGGVPQPDDRWGHSLDRIILVLLARDDAHRARGRKSIPRVRQTERAGEDKDGSQG